MRSALFFVVCGGSYATFVAGACTGPYQGEDNELVDRSEANAPIDRDAGRPGSSSGQPAPEPGPIEAGSDAEPSAEGPCDPSKGVGVLADIAGLVSADSRTGARLSLDELHIAFLQVRDTAAQESPMDTYVASRSSKAAAFGAPQRVDVAAAVNVVSLAADGLSMYFTPTRPNGGNGVQLTTRTSTDAPFTGAAAVPGVPGFSYSPFATADGALLFSQYPERAPSTLLRATISGMTVTNPTPLFASSSGNDVDYPTLSADGTELFYTEYPPPSGFAYRRATRTTENTFVAAPMAGLDESRHEVTWVSPDACRVYVSDWRSYTLRIARRLP